MKNVIIAGIVLLVIEDKPKFKKGDWITITHKSSDTQWLQDNAYTTFMIISDTEKSYYNNIMAWTVSATGEYDNQSGGIESKYFRLATKEEITDHLCEIAKLKGFKLRARYYELPSNIVTPQLETQNTLEGVFNMYQNTFGFDGCGWCYNDGKWAKVLNPTLAGYEIKIVDYIYVEFKCNKGKLHIIYISELRNLLEIYDRFDPNSTQIKLNSYINVTKKEIELILGNF